MSKGSLRLSMGGSFTPLVLSATGGMGQAVAVAYKRMASLLAEKWGQPYCRTMGWLRCALSFSLIRLALQCIVAPDRPDTGQADCLWNHQLIL